MAASESPPKTARGSIALNVTARGSGSWLMTLRERQTWAAGWVQQLDVELLFPTGPAAAGANQPPTEPTFQRRRGRVRRAELTIEQAALNRSLSQVVTRYGAGGPPSAMPFDLIRARIDGGDTAPSLLLLFRCKPAVTPDAAAPSGELDDGTERGPLWGTARVAARRPPPGANDIVFGLSEVRLYGKSRIPAPILGHALLASLGVALVAGSPAELPQVALTTAVGPLGLHLLLTPALSELRAELLHDAVLDVLPRAGHRAADPSTAPLCEITALPGQLVLRYAADGQRGGLTYSDIDERPRSNPAIEPSALMLGAPTPEAVRIADHLLQSGDTGAALAAYKLISTSSVLSQVARTRCLQVGVIAETRKRETVELGEDELSISPTSSAALIALAALAENNGNVEAAARRYLALGADMRSHAVERAAAFFAASRYLVRSDPAAARSARGAAESLLTPGGPEEPLLLAVQAAAQEVPRKPVSLPPQPPRAVEKPPEKPPVEKPVEPPAAEKPVDRPIVEKNVAKPIVEKPIVEKPIVEKPIVEKPIVEKPIVEKPVVEKTVVEKPVAKPIEKLIDLPPVAPPVEPVVEAPPGETAEARRRRLIDEAQIAAQRGEIDRSRALLTEAGPHPDVLRARTQLDWPELLQAEPGSSGDLLPILRNLQALGAARPEELRGLARLLTARGEYAEALSVQTAAQGDPDELLASLEAAGKNRELLAALAVHAQHRPETSCLLHQQAANVAEHQLADRELAASYWQKAAESASGETRLDDIALFWFHAGRLWHEQGDSARAYGVLVRAVELCGNKLPRLTLLLADLAYKLGDLEASSLYYRQSLDSGQVPPGDRARAYLRVAEAASLHKDAQTEEQALARAVEEGAGDRAWPRLSALFREQKDWSRLGAALVAWADHERGDKRIALLREATELVQPGLLPRIDDELWALKADDDGVRDRIIARLEERGEQDELLPILRRDVERSRGVRRKQRARRLVELALKLSAYSAAVEGFLAILGEAEPPTGKLSPQLPPDIDEALAFWGKLQRARASLHVPPALLEALRQRILEAGQLAERWAAIEAQLEQLDRDGAQARRSQRLVLLGRAAQLAELLGYHDSSAQRYLQLGAAIPAEREVLGRLRRVLRSLAQAGRADEALALVDGELRRLGGAAPNAIGLRIALAELYMFIGRGAEALAQLELILLRAPDLGPGHALLGMLLGTSAESGEVHRGLEHLLIAAYAPDVEAHEAGECALMAADVMASAGISEPVDLATLRAVASPAPGYTERAIAGHFVAVPADFLESALDEEAAPEGGQGEPAFLRPGVSPLPPLLGPVELLLHASALLPGDPRPLEGLLGLSWSRGDYTQALECCERLLGLPIIAGDKVERSRIRVEKAHVLSRLSRPEEAESLLRKALVDVPESLPALRALRRLVEVNGRDSEALSLLQAEMKLFPDEDRSGMAALWGELGGLQSKLGQFAESLQAFRRAGQLGLYGGWQKLAEGLAEQGDFLGAADAAGRAAALLPARPDDTERGPILLRAAELALRADDELRARDYLAQAAQSGGESGVIADERLRELDGGAEPEKRRRALERRLKHVGSGIERLEVLRRLVLLCTELYERPAMLSYATTLLREAPGDALALCVLAEDAIEHGQHEAAAARIIQAGMIPPNYPRMTRLLACLAEVLERRGNVVAAASAFQRLLEAAERVGDVPAVELGIEGLARLREEQGDAADALRWLRRRLPYLPPEAVSGRATLRLRMSDLAMALGDLDEARQQLNAVLEESPGQRSALVKLLDVYKQLEEPEAALRILDRLLDVTMTPGERAEWLFQRAELVEKQLGNLDEAASLYEKVLSQWPAHARALRRLIALAVQRGDGAKVAQAVTVLAKAGAPLADVHVLAGIGLLLDKPVQPAPRSDDFSPTVDGHALLRTASPAELANALCAIDLSTAAATATATEKSGRGADLRRLDGPLGGALRALSGDAAPLLSALRQRLQQSGFDAATVRVLARLCEQLGRSEQSLYLSALAFLEPGGYADERLDELGALPVPEVALEAALLTVRPMPAEQAPWLICFGLLGRHVLGLQAPVEGGARSAKWEERLGELGRMLGLPQLEVVLAKSDGDASAPTDDPATCDPTRPPRLRIAPGLESDEAQLRFSALRALHLLRAGLPLAERGGPEGMSALLRAAAALWLEGTAGVPRVEDISELLPRERDWLSTLRALALHPEFAPGVIYEARAETDSVQRCLATLIEHPQRLGELWPALLETARLEASARALGQLGDLRAALRALYSVAPRDRDASPAEARQARIAALSDGPLFDLLAIAARIYE